MSNNVVKSRNYNVELEGKVYKHRLDLCEYGGFQYGNQTCVAHYDGVYSQPTIYDTRYEVGIVKNFESWADNFIKDWCNPNCKISVEI